MASVPPIWRRAWRRLTAMRTALLLLFVLALSAVPGSLLPQRGLPSQARIDTFVADHRLIGPVLERLGFFNVFGSVWFAAVYGLLAVSLVGCLIPRIRLHARNALAAPPSPPRSFVRLPQRASWTTDRPPEELLERARAELRRRHWRARVVGDTVAAEKGHSRETGNLLFHVSLLALLVFIGYGAAYGYKAVVAVTEGDTFTNTPLAYDAVKPGRFASVRSLPPFSVTLDDFRATYQADGDPKDFRADVHYQPMSGPDGSRERASTVRVNTPLTVEGARVYLLDHGFAPEFEVRDRTGRVVAHETVQSFVIGPNNLSAGVLKVPNPGAVVVGGVRQSLPQIGVTFYFYPTLGSLEGGRTLYSRAPDAQEPAIEYEVYAGDLGLASGVPQPVDVLDTTAMKDTGGGVLFPGGVVTKLPGGASLRFVGVKEFAVFQVTRDPSKEGVLVAAVLALLGLVASLRIRRRRVWVRTSLGVAGTVVEVGGLPRTDRDTFAREFRGLVARIGGPPDVLGALDADEE